MVPVVSYEAVSGTLSDDLERALALDAMPAGGGNATAWPWSN